MMKKIYISTILFFAIFFTATNVKAETQLLVLDAPVADAYTGAGSTHYRVTTTAQTWHDLKFYYPNYNSLNSTQLNNLNGNQQRLMFQLTNNNDNIDESREYDIAIVLSTNSTNKLYGVSIANSFCDSYDYFYLSPSGGGTNFYSGMVQGFVCRNVSFIQHKIYLNIWGTPEYTNQTGLVNAGIYEVVQFVPSNSQNTNDIVESLQQQTEEIKKTTEAVDRNTEATKEINNTIKDSSVDNQQAEGFFNDFNDNSHGLSGIITAPLNMINNLASATCSPINVNIPFVDTAFTLPCMSTIYQQNFGTLFSIYRTITFGIVAYYVCVNIFALVKGFKDPENDKVEVVEL